jgi:predicted nucleic acid-binding protein
MAANVLVDAGFLVALLSRRDAHHRWAAAQAAQHSSPWKTCGAALSEAFHLVGTRGTTPLGGLLRRGAVTVAFDLGDHVEEVVKIMRKYEDLPASLADACLVRMTEVFTDPVLLTTDSDFRIYRRHSRQAVPCVTPS